MTAAAWGCSTWVAPAQGSRLCSRRPPVVSQGDAARPAPCHSRVQAQAGVRLQGAGRETTGFLNRVSALRARPQRGTLSAERWLLQ